MKIKELILELRSNPKDNPKLTVFEVINDAMSKTTDTIAGVKNVFVSFGDEEKLGINPKYNYHTPVGIYSYSAEYVLDETVNGRYAIDNLPFGGSKKYANVFNGSGNIIDLDTIGDGEVNEYYKKIINYANQNWKMSDDVIEGIINDFGNTLNASGGNGNVPQARFSEIPGARLWYVMRAICAKIAPVPSIKFSTIWNKLFRAIGIDGCIDNGEGIIHSAIPNQAVFFSIKNVTNNKRIDNRLNYRRQELDTNQRGGQRVKNTKTEFRNLPSEEKYLQIVKNNPTDVRYIKNPSEAVQLAVVTAKDTNRGHNIEYILQTGTIPSEAVQLAAVANGSSALLELISYNIVPSEAVQSIAVNDNTELLRYIKNPSDAVRQVAQKAKQKRIDDIARLNARNNAAKQATQQR